MDFVSCVISAYSGSSLHGFSLTTGLQPCSSSKVPAHRYKVSLDPGHGGGTHGRARLREHFLVKTQPGDVF